MNHHQEGYIKFHCDWQEMSLAKNELIGSLIQYRQELYRRNLIGMLENEIGFGNISHRISGTNNFIITGSATGKFKVISEDQVSLVTKFDIPKNYIECCGKVEASSESLTHAAIYLTTYFVNAVIHTHNSLAWHKYSGVLPTTSENAAYGTPDIAAEIIRLLMKPERKGNVIIMGGHEDGIITFGKNLHDACRELYKLVG